MGSDAVVLEVDGPHGVRQVRLSSPARVMWPQAGLTKRDLADYVVAVGPALMTALGDRPVTLQRFPDGVDGEEFFSKNPPRGVPEWVRTVTVTYPSGRRHPQLVVDEPATALWTVQMNTVTWHPWPVRTANLDNPDELRIDLDPQPGTDFADAKRVAGVVHEVLDELGWQGWPKTSGNRGVHIYVRIKPDHGFKEVRRAALAFAREVERRAPDRITTAWWKEERGEKVFVDFNQNAKDRTIAAAYSVRGFPHGPVSAPVTWAELPDVDTEDFTLATVPKRFAELGDVHAGIDDVQVDIAPLLEWSERDERDHGLGEAPYPPNYPKMEGEPLRVQPSRARKPPVSD
jgi:DNA ligase D